MFPSGSLTLSVVITFLLPDFPHLSTLNDIPVFVVDPNEVNQEVNVTPIRGIQLAVICVREVLSGCSTLELGSKAPLCNNLAEEAY